ncbi:MAG: dihydroorotase [Paludibacter sp.]|jgi:dihydroorotase|nr:dihydroorotase [Paludibacter sp.]
MSTRRTLISNATIINEQRQYIASVVICDSRIEDIFEGENSFPHEAQYSEKIDARGMFLFPGAIDVHVHFREPGLTHKADIASESRAAAAGGVTTFMDMPNSIPQTTTIDNLEAKYTLAAQSAVINYSFYLGATNDNFDQIRQLEYGQACGIKIFLGASTGNMLVNKNDILSKIFAESQSLIAVHSEDETIITANKAKYKALFGDNIPIEYHPLIRSAEACYVSTAKTVEMAHKYGTRLHVAHISTARELALFESDKADFDKKITAEACVHHLWFCGADYKSLGTKIKCNPAIKTAADRQALRQAINSGKIDLIATDHAPHLLSEKQGDCLTAASGCPIIQYSLTAMLELAKQNVFTYATVAEKMCHAPALLYRVKNRGFIRQGYYADLVLVNPNCQWEVNAENILSKCAWSPFESTTFSHKIQTTWVNGQKVYDNGKIDDAGRGQRIEFI